MCKPSSDKELIGKIHKKLNSKRTNNLNWKKSQGPDRHMNDLLVYESAPHHRSSEWCKWQPQWHLSERQEERQHMVERRQGRECKSVQPLWSQYGGSLEY
jgi:hypothetical protein